MINLKVPRPDSQLPDENLQSLYALAMSTPPGDFLELGVYRGGSAWVLNEAAKIRGHRLHLFDTFTGIPEKTDIDVYGVGAFSDTTAQEVMAQIPDAVFHVGKFPDTLHDSLTDLAFVHVDCDQYDSCRLAIMLLWPRLLPGGVMAFDDYPFAGIKKAITDFAKGEPSFTQAQVPYLRKGAG